jgi:hypothetical protein
MNLYFLSLLKVDQKRERNLVMVVDLSGEKKEVDVDYLSDRFLGFRNGDIVVRKWKYSMKEVNSMGVLLNQNNCSPFVKKSGRNPYYWEPDEGCSFFLSSVLIDEIRTKKKIKIGKNRYKVVCYPSLLYLCYDSKFKVDIQKGKSVIAMIY